MQVESTMGELGSGEGLVPSAPSDQVRKQRNKKKWRSANWEQSSPFGEATPMEGS